MSRDRKLTAACACASRDLGGWAADCLRYGAKGNCKLAKPVRIMALSIFPNRDQVLRGCERNLVMPDVRSITDSVAFFGGVRVIMTSLGIVTSLEKTLVSAAVLEGSGDGQSDGEIRGGGTCDLFGG